ncbi:MAG: class I SAM-dependent methyltransferase [Candidatus Acidiferrales bacterium]
MNQAVTGRAASREESLAQSPSSGRCPACGRPATAAPLEHSHQSALYACVGCDLHFWHPVKMPDASWYEAAYQGRDHTAMPLEPGHLFFLSDPQAPKQGRLLDMGCGTGNFLAAARDTGFDVTGIEPNQNAIRFAQERYGLRNVFASVPAEFQKAHPLEKFGTVTFFEVLEHQDDPQAFLDTAEAFLQDDGFIALSVPNRNRWQVGADSLDYPPNHLTRWSPKALRNFLERNGFEVLSLREQPLHARRAAQMLSATFRTGMISRVAGERPAVLSDLAEMPSDEVRRKMERVQQDPRQGLATRLAGWKSRAMLPVAALLLPYFRLRGRTGLYLYCLARRRRESPASARAARQEQSARPAPEIYHA